MNSIQIKDLEVGAYYEMISASSASFIHTISECTEINGGYVSLNDVYTFPDNKIPISAFYVLRIDSPGYTIRKIHNKAAFLI